LISFPLTVRVINAPDSDGGLVLSPSVGQAVTTGSSAIIAAAAIPSAQILFFRIEKLLSRVSPLW
jgi:hypothetical protein